MNLVKVTGFLVAQVKAWKGLLNALKAAVSNFFPYNNTFKIIVMVQCLVIGWMVSISAPYHLFNDFVTSVEGEDHSVTCLLQDQLQIVTDLGFAFMTGAPLNLWGLQFLHNVALSIKRRKKKSWSVNKYKLNYECINMYILYTVCRPIRSGNCRIQLSAFVWLEKFTRFNMFLV